MTFLSIERRSWPNQFGVEMQISFGYNNNCIYVNSPFTYYKALYNDIYFQKRFFKLDVYRVTIIKFDSTIINCNFEAYKDAHMGVYICTRCLRIQKIHAKVILGESKSSKVPDKLLAI